MRATLEEQLEDLLDESPQAALRRERAAFDELAAPHGERLVLFGAGGLGRKTLAGLRRAGVEPLAFADNDTRLWGTVVEGLPVLAPAEAAERYGSRAAFVVAIWRAGSTDVMGDRMRQLRELGCETVVAFVPLFWKHADVLVPHYAVDLPHRALAQADAIRAVFPLWADDASRAEFVAQVRWRLHADFDALPAPVGHEAYFPDDLVDLRPDEVVVDCGAYDGDTIRSLVRHDVATKGRIVAFEPDPANYEALQRYVETLPATMRKRIVLHQAAVGARDGTVRFDSSGTASSAVGDGGAVVDCVRLDGVLDGTVPTCVKMDIEGSELDALEGAAAVIRDAHPVMAVCAYHRQDHLWRVPATLAGFTDRYRYYLRPHALEVWDLVCYAVPASRLKSPA